MYVCLCLRVVLCATVRVCGCVFVCVCEYVDIRNSVCMVHKWNYMQTYIIFVNITYASLLNINIIYACIHVYIIFVYVYVWMYVSVCVHIYMHIIYILMGHGERRLWENIINWIVSLLYIAYIVEYEYLVHTARQCCMCSIMYIYIYIYIWFYLQQNTFKNNNQTV